MARIINLFDRMDGYGHRPQRRPHRVRDRVDPLQIYDDVDLVAKYRFRRADITLIINQIEGDLQHGSNRNGALSPTMQLLVALRFYASGSFQSVIGDGVHVSPSTVCRCIRRVSLALTRLFNNYVILPHNEQYSRRIKEDFGDIADFPDVISCIDGTQIPIQAPSHDELEYVNRKGFHSINIQVMCDLNLKFVDAVIRWPGSTHDSRILANSNIYREFENGNYNGIVLGDSGYPLRNWLMVPYLRPATDAEEAYNTSQIKTRSIIERSIGDPLSYVLKLYLFYLS